MTKTTKPKLRTEQIRNGLQTVIETDVGERYATIPLADFDRLIDIYDSLEHPGLVNPNWRFAVLINQRLFTEWCDNTPWEKHYNYSGEGFLDFVSGETHHELVRKGCKWDEGTKQFTGLTSEQYLQTRDRVLGGLALKAIELFTDWNGRGDPPYKIVCIGKEIKSVYEDKRNLRCDLSDYNKRAGEFLSLGSARAA